MKEISFKMGKNYEQNRKFCVVKVETLNLRILQPRSQGLRGETVTKTLVKFILSFQNFGEKIACAVRHNRIAIQLNMVEYGCVIGGPIQCVVSYRDQCAHKHTNMSLYKIT